MQSLKHSFYLMILCIMLGMSVAAASENAPSDTVQISTFSPHHLGRLPILHEGRIKPLDSFARYHFKKFSGREADAMQWLAESLFNPAYAENLPVMHVTNPDVLSLLQLPKTDSKRYSYNVVKAALADKRDIIQSILDAPQDQWSKAHLALIELYDHTAQYGDILGSLSLFLPLSVQLPSDVSPALRPIAERPVSYADVKPLQSFVMHYIENIIETKGTEIASYNEAEQAATFLSYSMSNLARAGSQGRIFTVIPSFAFESEKTHAAWQTPWHIIDAPTPLQAGQHHPDRADFLRFWQSLAESYHRADQSRWDTTIQKLQTAYRDISVEEEIYRPKAVKAEYIYNKIDPYLMSCFFYAATLLFLGLMTITKPQSFISTALKMSAILTLYIGAFIHVMALITRVYIMQRPPVSTLYESILFVGVVAVLYGLYLYHRKRESIWLWITGFLGIIIHILGFSHVQDGASFLMLPAVLNTNFWLATHVIIITMGYAFCVMTSVYAHYQLYILGHKSPAHYKNLRGMGHLAVLSLLFCLIGTILGGIWADQSWGRFWGWDPKENGALLIVLWLIWMMHGRVAGLMSERTYLAGMSYLSVIVALSWFGVNLLGVGLHAYGFTDTAVIALSSIVIFETLFISVLYLLSLKKDHKNNKKAGTHIK